MELCTKSVGKYILLTSANYTVVLEPSTLELCTKSVGKYILLPSAIILGLSRPKAGWELIYLNAQTQTFTKITKTKEYFYLKISSKNSKIKLFCVKSDTIQFGCLKNGGFDKSQYQKIPLILSILFLKYKILRLFFLSNWLLRIAARIG